MLYTLYVNFDFILYCYFSQIIVASKPEIDGLVCIIPASVCSGFIVDVHVIGEGRK